MESSTLTFWNSGVWLIPLILLATIGGLVAASRYMRKSTQAILKKIRTELRQAAARRRSIASQIQDYIELRQEPFQSPVISIQNNLVSVGTHILEFEKQMIAIQHELRRTASLRGLALIGAPLVWYQLVQQSKKLLQAVTNIQPILEDAEKTSQKLSVIAWDIAILSRELLAKHLHDEQIFKKLIAENVIGGSIDKEIVHQESVKKSLEMIPDWLLMGDHAVVQDHVASVEGKETVVSAYRLLNELQSTQESIHSKAINWEQDKHQVSLQVLQLGEHLDKISLLLDDPSLRLDVREQQQALKTMYTIYDQLNSTLNRLEVDDLGQMIAEARRVQSAATNLEDRVLQAKTALADLEALFPELSEGLKEIAMQFAVLGTSKIRPIAWGKGRAALTSLNRQVKTLSQDKQTHTASQIAMELETAQRLHQKIKELITYSRDLSAGHDQLRDLLMAPEFKDWKSWLSEAQILADRTSQYAPENWLRGDNVQNLSSDLATLEVLLSSLVGDDLSLSIDEADVAQVLDETSKLLPVYQAQRSRVANIRDRLAELQLIEGNSQEQLDRGAAFLKHVALLIQSNEFLKGKVTGEAGRLLKETSNISDEFRQRDRGSLEKKSRQVDALITRITTAARKWLELLNVEINTQVKDLSSKIAGLNAIAPLDEPALERARELLSRVPTYLGHNSEEDMSPTDQPVLLELRRRCEFLENLAASQRALGNTADDILENYERASANRLIARDRIQEISNQARNLHGWPPTTVTFLGERQELGELEEQWESIKSQRVRGVTLAAQLGSLSARYLSLGEKVQQAIERADQDQDRVIELENELGETIQLWQVQARAYSASPLASREIHNLIANAEREMDGIRKSYQQGNRNYNQVLQSMRLLARNLGIALVMVDDEHSIDIRGRVIRAR